MLAQALLAPVDTIRGVMVRRVRAVFNDLEKGERPVPRSDDALFARGSVVQRVHGDVTTMMVGGIAALLLQMLHPAALAGVLDFSNFRTDMLGRLRRTARFIALTSFGERDAAEAAIVRVRSIHDAVRGTTAEGLPYAASDPRLLAWVHAAEALCFLDAWIAYGEPMMSEADQDGYFAQFALVARKLGADPVPESRAEAEALIEGFRPELRGTPEAREVARLILASRRHGPAAAAVQAVIGRAAVGLLPAWARPMLDLDAPGIGAPLVRGATSGMAATLRRAFAGEARKRSGAARPKRSAPA